VKKLIKEPDLQAIALVMREQKKPQIADLLEKILVVEPEIKPTGQQGASVIPIYAVNLPPQTEKEVLAGLQAAQQPDETRKVGDRQVNRLLRVWKGELA
jgi:hypothetical protein